MPFNKIILLALMVLAVGAGAAYAATRDNSPAPSGSTGVADVSGPCDEAEHANDPRCMGAQVPEDDVNNGDVEDRNDDDAAGEDISGPCDEAEHANDPRCTGGQVSGDDDNSGPGDASDDDDDNSGPGNGDDENEDDEDNSGSGSSGSGHSGGGDDNSGPGGGGDDD
jgi:hypothetical protein